MLHPPWSASSGSYAQPWLDSVASLWCHPSPVLEDLGFPHYIMSDLATVILLCPGREVGIHPEGRSYCLASRTLIIIYKQRGGRVRLSQGVMGHFCGANRYKRNLGCKAFFNTLTWMFPSQFQGPTLFVWGFICFIILFSDHGGSLLLRRSFV